jgi:MFS family permease
MTEQRPFSLTYAWFVVVTMLIANVISLTDRMVISLLVVPIQDDLHLADADMGWIMGIAFGLFYSLMGLPLGRMVDRLHRARLIAGGMFIWSMMTIASGLSDSFWELFFARMGVGIGEAVLAPAAWSLVADMFPPNARAKALSVIQLGGIVGVSMGYLLGGMVFSLAKSPEIFAGTLFEGLTPWRTVFILAAIPGLLLMLLVATIREPRAAARVTSVPLSDVTRYLRGSGRALFPVLLGLACIMVTIFSVNAWTPALITRKFGLSSDEIGFYFGLATFFGGVPGTLAGGWLTDRAMRAGRHDVYWIIPVIGAAGVFPLLALIDHVGTVDQLIVLIGLFYFISLLPNGVIIAYSQRASPPRMRGTIGALNILCGNLIGYSGPATVAFVSDGILGGKAHIGQALAIVGGSFALTALLLFTINRRKIVALSKYSEEGSEFRLV